MITSEQILDQLKKIIDPDFQKDIVSLGFVQNIKIEGSHVKFDIALTTPACPVKDQFKADAEKLVKQIPGVKDVSINMTVLSKSAMPQPNTENLKDIGSIIAVSSCKGGVGKSTVAAHIARELARRGFAVGLVDVDIHGPSVPTLFGLQNETLYVNAAKQFLPMEKFGLKIMSFGFMIGDAPAVMRGPIVSRYVQQILLNTAWGKLDYLLIDMPPGTGDVQLTITQTLRLNGAVIVTTPQTLSLVDVARGILMFERVNVPILGIVENMAHFICDNCDKKHYIFGNNAKTLKERFGLDTLGELPIISQNALQLDAPKADENIRSMVDTVVRSVGRQSLTVKQIPSVTVNPQDMVLAFADGTQLSLKHRDVRLSCRCALCVNELTGEQMLKPDSVKADIAPQEIFPLGNYALGITWNDGHSSGIYPYETLKKLGQGVATS